MSIQILWQSEVNGKQSRCEFKLLGEAFVMTYVGDVIVDTAWLSAQENRRIKYSKTQKALEEALFFQSKQSLPLKLLQQGTAYSRGVWLALTEIPVGKVMAYSELANQLKSGPRAVAQACRNNPYPGIIPCHRVVAKAGIGGFMGQSEGEWVELKRRLLKNEREIRMRNREWLDENH